MKSSAMATAGVLQAGRPCFRQINLIAGLGKLNLDQHMIVVSNPVVYTPPAQRAKAGPAIDQLFLFHRVAVGALK